MLTTNKTDEEIYEHELRRLRWPPEEREKIELEEDRENQKYIDRENKIYSKAAAKFEGLLVLIVCDNANVWTLWNNELKNYNPTLYIENRPHDIIASASEHIENISKKSDDPGCIIIDSSMLREKEFLNEINKNVPVF